MQPADPKKQEHYYGAQGQELSLNEFKYEMIYSNSEEVIHNSEKTEIIKVNKKENDK